MVLSVDPSSPSAIEELNKYFLVNSYVAGYDFSDEDKKLFDKIGQPIDKDAAPNAARWYNHIKLILSNPDLLKLHSKTDTKDESEEEVDLFGDDDEEEIEKMRQDRAQNLENSNKKTVIQKSLIVMDIKPWEDSTNLEEMEHGVRAIVKDGLVWGTSSLEPLGYGIKKLRIACVVEDNKVSVDELTAEIEENLQDHVQSVDIASFNKL